MVGQDGERWVPVHGNLPLSAAQPCLTAALTFLDSQEAALQRHGVRVNWLLLSLGAHLTMEPMFYWRDALDPLHLKFLSDRNRARFAGFAEIHTLRTWALRRCDRLRGGRSSDWSGESVSPFASV